MVYLMLNYEVQIIRNKNDKLLCFGITTITK